VAVSAGHGATPMRFEFSAPARIIFGPDTAREIGPLAAGYGQRVLLVTNYAGDEGRTVLDYLVQHGHTIPDWLAAAGVEITAFAFSGEPTVTAIEEGVALARDRRCEAFVSVGGGSAMDAGKAISTLVANGGEPLDYLEVIGRGQPITQPACPLIAVPTTAGTGAEVTRNAVLDSPEHAVKVSLRSPLMLPRVALVDPLLTHSAPAELTASAGLDALTQNIEPYVSNKANPVTDAISRAGMQHAARSLRQAYEHPDDADAREDMALSSLFGGLALANAKLGAVHGFAGPLGGTFHGPHGAICAALLPHAMAVNVRALRERQSDSEALHRYTEVACLVTGHPGADAEDGVRWIADLVRDLHIPGLRAYGVTPDAFEEQVNKAAVSSSMQGNPIQLTHDEMVEILERAL